MRITLSSDDAKLLKQVSRQFPELPALLSRLRQAELESMALCSPEHFSTYKGRVQCLTELRQHLQP